MQGKNEQAQLLYQKRISQKKSKTRMVCFG